MSKLLENKQIVHIATEVVILIGITFYFSSKNRNLLNHIEDLSTKIEDLEDLVQKHERMINHLMKIINSSQPPPKIESQPPKVKQTQKRNIKKPSFKKEEVVKKPAKVSFKQEEKPITTQVIEEDDGSSDDSDLDKEIEEELNELMQEEEKNKTSIDSLDENVVEIDLEDGLNER